MEKNEVLELSQKENKQKDLYEQDLYKTSALVGTVVGWCVIALTCLLTGVLAHKCNFTALFIMCAIESGIFIAKYVKARKKHELFVSIVYVVLAVVLFVLFMLDVLGVTY